MSPGRPPVLADLARHVVTQTCLTPVLISG